MGEIFVRGDRNERARRMDPTPGMQISDNVHNVHQLSIAVTSVDDPVAPCLDRSLLFASRYHYSATHGDGAHRNMSFKLKINGTINVKGPATQCFPD